MIKKIMIYLIISVDMVLFFWAEKIVGVEFKEYLQIGLLCLLIVLFILVRKKTEKNKR